MGKTHLSGGRVQVRALPAIWQRLKTIEVLTAKSMAELLGPRSGTAWAGRTGEHEQKVFPSLLQSLLAATDSL